ncbi:MAG: (2Fe-2S)-binding protein [Proteobacteria bacterium]|nr:(2Fe-2S)-binding protein [Pseudomonadota bacterium]
MIFVCICRRYREQDIRRAAHAGLRSAHDIYKELGAEPSCGRCLEFAEQVIRDVHVGTPATNASGAAQAA